MTWRLIPQQYWRRVQFVTLIVTALVGVSMAVAPQDEDAKLTILEQAMNVDLWALGLVALSTAALLCEIDMTVRKHERWVNLVGYLHIALCSLMAGYAAAAFVGVLFRIWWNFGAPALAGLLSYLHFTFVKRQPPRA